MVAAGLSRPLLAVRTAVRKVSGWVGRQLITGNRRGALTLTVVTAVISVAAVQVSESWFSPGLLILPVLAGGLLLWPRALRILFVLIAAGLAYDTIEGRAGPGLIATIAVTAVVADLRLVPERGTLRPGDALMLYTDGLVETPGQDIDYGTDRLLGEADKLVSTGFRAGAADLVRAMASGVGSNDDRALAIIWRG